MGFFQKLKDNFKKGGVKVELQSPGSSSYSDESIALSVVITNGETPRTVNSVRIVLEREVDGQNSTGAGYRRENVRSYNIPDSMIQLQANESRTFSVNFPMTMEATLDNAGVADTAAQSAANVLDKISKVAEAVSDHNATYFLSAVADVDGITLDPSDRKGISINKPGQIGTTINL